VVQSSDSHGLREPTPPTVALWGRGKARRDMVRALGRYSAAKRVLERPHVVVEVDVEGEWRQKPRNQGQPD
jgi:hypothetical protein